MKQLHSLQNPTVKKMVGYLEKSRDRKKDEVFVVEGVRENARALAKGYVPLWIFYPESIAQESQIRDLMGYYENEALVHACSDAVFSKLAYRSGVLNVVAVYRQRSNQLESLQLPENPLLLIVEAVEKPGNLGAILRTANAAKVDAVIVADGVVDIYHPHVIRNSLGGFFDIPLVAEKSTKIISYLKERKIPCMVTFLEGATPHFKVDLTGASAIVMGAEDKGVSKTWIESADTLVKIPMSGVVDSLNVSVAAGIMLFEAVRQRFE